jgi:Domain of unknown function (DUF4158)
MARVLNEDELIEHWTLVGDELDLLTGRTGPSKLGLALWLKFFIMKGCFPAGRSELPDEAVGWVASHVKVPGAEPLVAANFSAGPLGLLLPVDDRSAAAEPILASDPGDPLRSPPEMELRPWESVVWRRPDDRGAGGGPAVTAARRSRWLAAAYPFTTMVRSTGADASGGLKWSHTRGLNV